MKTMMPRVYLGDAVYAQFGEGYLKLTVEYSKGPEETIFLDQTVLVALEHYINMIKESNAGNAPIQTDTQTDGSKS